MSVRLTQTCSPSPSGSEDGAAVTDELSAEMGWGRRGDTDSEERPTGTEADVGVLRPQARESLGPPGAGRNRRVLPQSPRGARPCPNLQLGPLSPGLWEDKFILF